MKSVNEIMSGFGFEKVELFFTDANGDVFNEVLSPLGINKNKRGNIVSDVYTTKSFIVIPAKRNEVNPFLQGRGGDKLNKIALPIVSIRGRACNMRTTANGIIGVMVVSVEKLEENTIQTLFDITDSLEFREAVSSTSSLLLGLGETKLDSREFAKSATAVLSSLWNILSTVDLSGLDDDNKNRIKWWRVNQKYIVAARSVLDEISELMARTRHKYWLLEKRNLQSKDIDAIKTFLHQIATPVAIIDAQCLSLIQINGVEEISRKNSYTKEQIINSITNSIAGVERLNEVMRRILLLDGKVKIGDYGKEAFESIVETSVVKIKNFDYKNKKEDQTINLECSIDFKGSNITTDIELIREIIETLLNNAIEELDNKFKECTEDQVITLSIRQYSNRKWEMSVGDSGRGIPSNVAERMFEEFYTHGKIQGTGIGLYQIKHLIEQLGGKIDFVTKEGEGTIFTVSFLG